MDKILEQFGIQPLLLAAQIVNFLVLLFILNKLLYKPILKVLQDRKERIAESLKNADEIEKKLLKTEEDREKKLQLATEEAKGIISDATMSANQIIADAHTKAALDIEELVAKAHESMRQERVQMHQEINKKIADLVVAGLQTVTGKVLTSKDQQELVKKSVKEIS
jgi:F-type H+-transporting ATPase subunit b